MGSARFSKKAGERIKRAVEIVEGQPVSTARNAPDRAKYPIISGTGGGRIGKTKSSGIPARTLAGSVITAGVGKGYLATYTGGATWGLDLTTEVDFYNSQNYVIPGDTVVQLDYRDGFLFVTVADC